MEKGRSKSSHLFQKTSVLQKTQRNALISSSRKEKKIFPKILPQQISHEASQTQIETDKKPIQKPIFKELRGDLLYIPKNFLEDIPNNNLNNSSFISFRELHKKEPLLYPDLNYISQMEKQIEEEKKRREENMTAIERFFKESRRDSQFSRPSMIFFNKLANFREVNQVIKELSHNESQKKMYETAIENNKHHYIQEIFENMKQNQKKMPPIKIYSTQMEKFERKQQNVNNIVSSNNKQNSQKDHKYHILYFDAHNSSKLSFYKYENISGNKPMTSEGATLTIIDDKAYLIGGRGANFRAEIYCFYIERKKWRVFKPVATAPYKENHAGMRMSHTANSYKNGIIIFGGEKEYNTNMRARQCLSDVQVYNCESREFTTLFCKGDMPEARKNHIAVIVGNQILIHGGMNSFSKCLKDAWILDLIKAQWISCEETLDFIELNGHTGVLVSENEKKFQSLFYPRYDPTKTNNYIKEEGIYIFGGRNQNNKASNTLYIIKIGISPFKVIKPETKGNPPIPRFNHAMKFCKYLNSIIIYGGRNDELNCCFSDIFTFDLETFAWTRLNFLESKYNEEKFSFAYDMHNTRILLFGGINFKGFLNNDLYVIEFDDNAQKKRLFEENNEEIVEIISPPIIRRAISSFKTFLPIPVSENNNNLP